MCPGCCGTVNLYCLGQWAWGNGQKFIERGKGKRRRHFRPCEKLILNFNVNRVSNLCHVFPLLPWLSQIAARTVTSPEAENLLILTLVHNLQAENFTVAELPVEKLIPPSMTAREGARGEGIIVWFKVISADFFRAMCWAITTPTEFNGGGKPPALPR